MSEKIQPTAYPLRMPTALREMLEESARNTKRSLNAEITDRLEESFTSPHLKQMRMGELTDALIEMGKEKGISVEVVFNYGADDEEQSVAVSAPLTTGIDKQSLIFDADEVHRSDADGQNHEEMSAAVKRAYEALQALDVMISNTATPKGPKPRKRYPKQ